MLRDNPKYQIAFHSEVHNCDFYIPAQDTEYHLSRYIAAQAQNIYSAAGITKELLHTFLSKMIEMCNDEKQIKTLRTDIAVLANNLLYRTKYPVDEDCALRMGAIYVFCEDENPDEVNDVFTKRKIDMCKGSTHNIATSDGKSMDIHVVKSDPELYSFFLTMGIKSTAAWSGLDSPLTDMDYFKNRDEQLRTLLPQSAV